MSVMRRSSSEPLRSVPRETANKTVVVTSMRRRVSSIPLLLFLLLAATLPRSITSQQPPPCNMCQQTGGEITNPNKIISVPGFEFIETCEALQAVLSFIGNETAECALVQSVGTICGCSRPPNACDLCPNGADVTKPDRTMPFLANLFNDIVPTCELAQAYMESSFDQNSDFCAAGPALLAGYCGCPNVEYDDDAPTCTTCIGEGEVERNRTISIPGFPFETCGQLDDAVDSVIKDGSYECELVQTVSAICGCPPIDNPCTLCKDGSSITLPDKEAHFAREIIFGVVPTCDFVEAYTAGHDGDSDFCELAQQASSFCGCPKKENHCVFCPDGGFPKETYRDNSRMIRLDEELRLEPTCELVEATQYQYGKNEGVCKLGELASFLCGCNDGEFDYVGADTDTKKGAIVWVARFFAFISFSGSVLIWYDILSNKRKRKQMYNRLILMMSIFDAATSISLLIGPAAQPEYTQQGTFINYFGSEGTTATCKIQGFFVQLGLTSVFYNLLLSIYYKLTIVNGWREERLKRSQKWFHGIPLALGFTCAFIGIPFYDVTPFGCHLYPIPVKQTIAWMIPLAYFPVIFTVLFLTAMMTYIYYKVLAQDKKADRWRIGGSSRRAAVPGSLQFTKAKAKASFLKCFQILIKGRTRKKSKLVNRVYWQAVAYVMSFLITWPVVCLALANSDSLATSNYGFWILFATVMPLQGFNNSWVYFRPRLSHRWEVRQKRLREKRQQQKQQKLLGKVQSEQTGETNTSSANLTDGAVGAPRGRRLSLMRANSDTSNQQAMKCMRIEDPSAYIAIAGFSQSSGSNSEKSFDDMAMNISQQIRNSDSMVIEFDPAQDVNIATTDELGVSYLGASSLSLCMGAGESVSTPKDDTRKPPLDNIGDGNVDNADPKKGFYSSDEDDTAAADLENPDKNFMLLPAPASTPSILRPSKKPSDQRLGSSKELSSRQRVMFASDNEVSKTEHKPIVVKHKEGAKEEGDSESSCST